MTVTPNSDTAPWDGGSRDPFQPQPPAQPPLEPVRRQSASRLRWVAALVVSLLVLGGLAVVFILANPPAAAGGVSALARYAPANSALYVELRLDLPGDQRDAVISFMRHFPGFADPGSFDQKVSDTLDQLLRAGDGDLSWSEDIEPWFGGQLVFFAGELEGGQGTPQSGTAVLSVKDRAALDRFMEKEGVASTYDASEHRGVTIWTGRLAGERTSVAVTGDALLISYRIEDMHAALDVSAGERNGLTDEARFSGAMSKLLGDRLLGLYLDGEAITEMMGGVPLTGGRLPGLEQAPGIVVGQLRAEAQHMLLEMRLLPRAGQSLPVLPQNRSSTLAAQFPADAVGYAEMRDLGQGVKQFVSQFLGVMGGGNGDPFPPPDIEQFLGAPPEDFLDFLGDAALAVSADGDRYGGGLVAELTDEGVARQRLERLVTSLRLMATFGGGLPLTIEEEDHGGVTLTVLRLEEIDGDEVPFSSISLAIANGRLLLGVDDFVTEALDRTAADSLAGSASYARALTAAGETNGGIFYLNMAEIRAIVEREAGQRERGQMDEFWPFFETFTQVMGTVSSDGDELVTRFLLFVE